MPDLRIVQPRELLREQVLSKLRNAIIEGWYPPGTRLTERELCEALGVSRTSVREVLRQLESEQLIRVEPRRGPVVASIEEAEAREIYETRRIIESALVRRFIERAPPEAYEALSKSLADFSSAADAGDRPGLLSSMTQFYDTLMEGAGNSVLHAMTRQLLARITFLRSKSMSEPGRLEHSVAEMREIAVAVRERDADRAERAVVAHVANAEKAALHRIADEAGKADIRS